MGHHTVVYGCIDGASWRNEDFQRLWRENAAVIDALPVRDDYPPLCRGMFAVTSGDLTSWRTQPIHFGYSTKNFEDGFRAWQAKLEGLLRRLYFHRARVHVEQEIQGDATLIWKPTISACRAMLEDPPVLPTEWDLIAEGPFLASAR